MSNMLGKLRSMRPDRAPADVSLSDWIGHADKFARPTRNAAGWAETRPGVTDSPELQRILALSRRPVVWDPKIADNPATALALVQLMTERLARPARACTCASKLRRQCITQLFWSQAWVLYEAPLAGGILGPIGVGHGKTGLDILTPMVMPQCRTAVLFIPPGLLKQFRADYAAWDEHFMVPSLMMPNSSESVIQKGGRPVLHVIPYSKFSRHESTTLLDSLNPDLIISDEGHKFRHRDTVATRRLLRYACDDKNQERIRFCTWSGTLTARSLKDFAHLSALALKKSSPLPIAPEVVEEWAACLDATDHPTPAGALRQLAEKGERVVTAFHRRLVETRGVVSTKASAINASLNIDERVAPPIPTAVAKHLSNLRATGTRPDGEELIDELSIHATARTLACGFYYRWIFPRMPKDEPARSEYQERIERWFAARKEWHKELREKLKHCEEHLDSPLLCANAAIRAYQETPYRGDLPVWHSETWQEWVAVRESIYYEKDPVWVDDYLARDCAEWAKKNRGIVWYEHDAFGRRVAELADLPIFGADSEGPLLAEKGNRSIIVSIKSHGTGRDGLQRVFCRQLVANPPSSGDIWEQLLGRLHRPGQLEDEVETEVYRHTTEMEEAIDKAVIQAKYIEGVMGTHQKLLCSSCSFSLD